MSGKQDVPLLLKMEEVGGLRSSHNPLTVKKTHTYYKIIHKNV